MKNNTPPIPTSTGIDEILNKLIDSGVIWLTKNDVINPGAVNKFAYARERLREEQRDRVPEIKLLLEQHIAAIVVKKIDGILPSREIEVHHLCETDIAERLAHYTQGWNDCADNVRSKL